MVKAEETREARMRRKVRKGTARARDAYVRFRKVTSLPTLIRRRWAARSLPRNAFTIPPGAGFLVLPPGRFSEVDEITAAAQATVAAADMDAKSKTAHKTFLVSLLNQSDLTLDSPLMRLALRPDIVSAVAGYLGVLPILEYINVLCSNHVQEPLSKSQLLHCDSDAETQVKIFVLCTEVTTENGPLVILGADSSRRLRARVTYRHNHRVTDEEAVAALGSLDDLHAITGPPGTICCVDTSRCFHYGSRIAAPTGRRLVVLMRYLTPWAFIMPPDYAQAARFRRLGAAASDPTTRAVLGAA